MTGDVKGKGKAKATEEEQEEHDATPPATSASSASSKVGDEDVVMKALQPAVDYESSNDDSGSD